MTEEIPTEEEMSTLELLRGIRDYIKIHKKGISAFIAGFGVCGVITLGIQYQQQKGLEGKLLKTTLVEKDEGGNTISEEVYFIFTNPDGTTSGLRDGDGDGLYNLFDIKGKKFRITEINNRGVEMNSHISDERTAEPRYPSKPKD